MHFQITGIAEPVSLTTAVIGETAHSLMACDFPVVGGPTNMEYMFRGISCGEVIRVLADAVIKAVVVMRLVDTYPGLVLNECNLFSTKFQTSSGKSCWKGSGSEINHFCRRAQVLSGCFQSFSRCGVDMIKYLGSHTFG